MHQERCVEIFGLGDASADLNRLVDALGVARGDVLNVVSQTRRRAVVELVSVSKVNEWERRSRELRLRVSDLRPLLEQEHDSNIKVFAASPARLKRLLYFVRNCVKNYKYVWIGRRGVMVRRSSRSYIHIIRTEEDVFTKLLAQT